jgi:hypothetical protein
MALVVLLVAILAVVVVCTIAEIRRSRAFNQRFPPISDAEFLARCRSDTNPAIALKVRQIVSKQLGVQYERIYPSSSFVEDLGCD